jgi:hypothetical protein
MHLTFPLESLKGKGELWIIVQMGRQHGKIGKVYSFEYSDVSREIKRIRNTATVSKVILACFPKMKVGLSSQQSVCHPLISFEPLDRFHEIWCGCNVIQGDLNVIIFNPIASVILELLRSKVVS